MPRALKIHPNLQAWFAQRQWEPFGFQKKVWRAIANQQSGLIHATTGSGKTYAAWLGALNQVLQSPVPKSALGLRVLWITPMRALASDTTKALQAPLVELGLDQAPWSLTVGQRTGDTSAAERARQTKKLPMALVTTPESLTLMLSRSVTRDQLAYLDLVVIDEWHELMGNKRGVQVQLALARLRHWRPQLSVWGLSATLGNLDQAMQVLLNSDQGLMVQGEVPKKIRVDTLLPDSTERFPWGGHLGLRMLPKVVAELEQSQSALVFTNTRAQAEIWYNALLDARPDWAGLIALHHGSLDKGVREWVEAGLKDGRLKAVVCTSSLDLGVDFSSVERVLQVGSAKGVARILQRAGRSGHAPGQLSRLSLVPTNALELIEGAALRDAIAARTIEPRHSPDKPLDVLVQHIVTIALSMQTTAAQLLQEVRSCYAYRNLTDQEWEWALSFTGHGGGSLTAYPEFHRIATRENSVLWVPDAAIARRHRMSVGTIVSDASVKVQYLNGSTIGTVEETFISRLKQGECFLFAGRLLELHRLHDMTAYVKKASGKRPAVPRWNGGKMPLSSELAQAFVKRLDQAALGRFEGADMQLAKPLLELQARWSSLPVSTVLLVEAMQSREGFHLFVYPFSGRHVHIGLSSLTAWRISQTQAATFSIAVNDYGFELLSATPQDWESELKRALEIKQTQPINSTSSAVEPNQLLLDDVLASLNASELSQRRFREIARISGLITQGYPGAPRSNKQLQASSSLFYEVFKKYDAQNLLLRQSEREVLQQELDLSRLQSCLIALQTKQLVFKTIEQPTPFAFPLMIERLREKLSTEKLSDRIARLVQELEKAATP